MNSPKAAYGDNGPLKVLIASSVYPPKMVGPAIQAELFARELARRGVEVRVLTYGPPAEGIKGVHVHHLRHSAGRGALATCCRQVSIAGQVHRLFRDFRPDVVQMQTAGGVLPLTVGMFARLYRTPSWVKFAGDPVVESLNQQASVEAGQKRMDWKRHLRTTAVKLLAKLVFRAHRFVWATTPTVAETLRCQWGVSPGRIVIEPNLVELHTLSRGDEAEKARRAGAPLRLLVVARLAAIKGVDVAIRALAELDQTHAVLRVLGEGQENYVQYLRSLAEQLGVSNSIEWAGKIPPERLCEEYRRADLLLVPSRYETFGVVIVEAMAAGLPVIASRVGGIPHVVQNGKCAQLVKSDDAPALARAISDIAAKRDQIARLRQAGLRRASEFSAEAGVGRWLKMFRESTDRPR